MLQPALAGLGPRVTRLVIVPDGPLHRLPWDALRLADGRQVVEGYAVSVAPSAAVVSALWRRPREAGASARPMRLLAFGDPTFAGAGEVPSVDDDAEVFRSAFKATGGLPRLQASARDIQLVAGYAPEAEVRLRQAASAAYLKHADLARFRILHFATHALVDEGTAARTALALAPGEGESGFVSPGELAALRLDADLVVLSACRTARGVVVEGEGVLGLTAPLLQAGARSVVATSWRIRDQAAVAFVKSFYDALARDLPVADALRSAKLDALRRGVGPNEWAVFTAVGDPLVRVPLRKPPLVASGWVNLSWRFRCWPQRVRQPISSGCASSGPRTPADCPRRSWFAPTSGSSCRATIKTGSGMVTEVSLVFVPQTSAPSSSSTSSS